jgi:methylmalonyl-CoA/ethylmalonyl-CoA epimerase
MSLVSKVHHINYLVRDLERSAESFSRRFGLVFEPEEQLPGRGVRLRRARLGELWLVLVQPTGCEGEAAQRLAASGEGVFLLSFAVDDLDAARKAGLLLGAEREGLDGWRVADLQYSGATTTVLQLCQERRR